MSKLRYLQPPMTSFMEIQQIILIEYTRTESRDIDPEIELYWYSLTQRGF